MHNQAQSGRVRRLITKIPVHIRLTFLVVILVIATLAITVLPLLSNNGPIDAEVAGQVPSIATIGQSEEFLLAIDNTSGSTISPVCLRLSFDRSVQLQSAIFQGLDKVPFNHGVACGGALSGNETVSVAASIVPMEVGQVNVTMQTTTNQKAVGPAVHGVMQVVASTGNSGRFALSRQ